MLCVLSDQINIQSYYLLVANFKLQNFSVYGFNDYNQSVKHKYRMCSGVDKNSVCGVHGGVVVTSPLIAFPHDKMLGRKKHYNPNLQQVLECWRFHVQLCY
jgi:hypothetical protein